VTLRFRLWPWRRQPATCRELAAVIDGIPRADLGNHVLSFAESLLRTQNPKQRGLHWMKIRLCCERIDRELAAAPEPDRVEWTVR
jgi:hypothetical protein